MSSSRGHRVELEPAYLLHQRDWRDSSRIIEFYARDHGRIALFAKGVRRPGSGLGAVLRPFVPILLTWQGSGDGGTLIAAESPQVTSLVAPACLMSGYYLNELLLKLLGREDPHPDVFEFYGATLRQLADPADERRALLIWVGEPEANAILIGLEKIPTPRPLTHDLAVTLVATLGGQLERVVITEVREHTFYAELHLRTQVGEGIVSSRPSDAIALAVRVGAPIFAEEALLDEAGVEMSADDAEGDPEAILDEFRDFLDDITPDDFAS